MRIRVFYTLLLLFAFTSLVFAQENRSTLPDLQTAESFFDPTRKENVQEDYKFATNWRIEAGYTQGNQRTQDTSAIYLHGLRLGATIDFVLPYRFSVQTGALASLTYGQNNQHWPSMDEESAQVNILKHNIVQLQLTIPVRAHYNVNLWKQLNLFVFAGPQLQIGLTSYDITNNKMSEQTTQWLEQQGLLVKNHDRYLEKQLYRTNIQFGLGGGLEWDRYRLQAGYDFGLNNILRSPVLPKQKMHEWGWMATFSYKL